MNIITQREPVYITDNYTFRNFDQVITLYQNKVYHGYLIAFKSKSGAIECYFIGDPTRPLMFQGIKPPFKIDWEKQLTSVEAPAKLIRLYRKLPSDNLNYYLANCINARTRESIDYLPSGTTLLPYYPADNIDIFY